MGRLFVAALGRASDRRRPFPFLVGSMMVLAAALAVTAVYAGESEARQCAVDCTARGYDAAECIRVCDDSDVVRAPADGLIDFRCVTACRDDGGTARDCRLRCRTQ